MTKPSSILHHIGILNLYSHENYLVNICRILSYSNYRTTLFVSEEVYERTRDQLCEKAQPDEWVIINKSTLGYSLSEVEYKLRVNKIDQLYLFPIYPNLFEFFQFLKFNPSCDLILSIYNINSWVGYNFRYPAILRHSYKIFLNRILIRRANAVILEYEPLRQFFASHKPKMDSYAFTPLLYTADQTPFPLKPKIVIPGFIEQRRRDYDLVLDVLESLKEVRSNFELVLLGSAVDASGDAIISHCKSLNQKGWNITFYSDWVPSDEFEKHLQTATLIWSPLQKKIEHTATYEQYGKTKGSGCIGDAVSHGKPLLLPAHYQVPNGFSPMIHTYDGFHDIKNLIEQMVKNPKILQERSHNGAMKFTPGEQFKRLSEILMSVNEQSRS